MAALSDGDCILGHPLKRYLEDVAETAPAFAARVGVTRQTVYRIMNGEQSPKPALARRIVEATGGAVSLDDLFGSGENGARIVPLEGAARGGELDHRRLRLAFSVVLNHLAPEELAGSGAIDLAVDAAANTFAALSSVTTRQGQARLTQALRPVLEEILREFADPAPSAEAIDRGAALATEIYYQSLLTGQ